MFRKNRNVKDVNEKRLRFTTVIRFHICAVSVRVFILTGQGYGYTVFCEDYEYAADFLIRNIELTHCGVSNHAMYSTIRSENGGTDMLCVTNQPESS